MSHCRLHRPVPLIEGVGTYTAAQYLNVLQVEVEELNSLQLDCPRVYPGLSYLKV